MQTNENHEKEKKKGRQKIYTQPLQISMSVLWTLKAVKMGKEQVGTARAWTWVILLRSFPFSCTFYIFRHDSCWGIFAVSQEWRATATDQFGIAFLLRMVRFLFPRVVLRVRGRWASSERRKAVLKEAWHAANLLCLAFSQESNSFSLRFLFMTASMTYTEFFNNVARYHLSSNSRARSLIWIS